MADSKSSIVPLISAAEREHWQLDADNVPIGPDERERWQLNPAYFYALERLHDACDELRDAVDDSVNETGIRLYGDAPSERLSGARERLERTQTKWTAALAYVDQLRRDRRES
jgi:hypothetical protein